MNYRLNALTEDFLKSHVHDFIAMSMRNIVGEYWGEEQFMSSLHKKWQLSVYVSNDDFPLMGFLIASEKEQSVHIHKFVIDSKFQQGGIGSAMLSHLLTHIVKPVTLKVDCQNVKAISFYTRHGFSILGEEKNMYAMILNSK